ncbi:MAG: kelch repeat-containing protein [Acidobacteriota bacterium]
MAFTLIKDRFCARRYRPMFSPYIDGEADSDARARLESHLAECARCRAEFENFVFASRLVSGLEIPDRKPRSLPAWIEDQKLVVRPQRRINRWLIAPVAAVGLIAALLIWFFAQPQRNSLEVLSLVGAPVIESKKINRSARIETGQWLETDRSSRAMIRIADLGHIEVDTLSRVRLVRSDANEQRLALDRGRLHASILAPPRIFFVETPSGVAIDLGCSYSLEVDDAGATLLYVTSGWVALTLNARESLVPAGAVCRSRPGAGPGTPYMEDASQQFKRALIQMDFEGGGDAALDTVLSHSRSRDALTLWHLIQRVEERNRARVFDRLSTLVPPPGGVTREGVIQLDRNMLDEWRDLIDFAIIGVNPALAVAAGSLAMVGPMNRPRYGHTATLLQDGRVLIAGGMEEERTPTGSAEIFDPATKTFTLIANLNAKRVGHTATRLADGRVLIAGGSGVIFYENALASAEIFDPATETFTPTENMHQARLGHRALLLPDGKVLITGGQTKDGAKLASAEIFDPQTGAFTSIRDMREPRSDHTMTLLKNGKVLIAGGANGVSMGREVVTETAEIYDPATGLFTSTGNMSAVRYKHSATLLPDGKVLILGGSNAFLARGMYPSAEVYDPATGKFSKVGNMTTARYKIRDAVALLEDGKVIVAGGGSRVEIYDPATGVFSAVAGSTGSPRYYSTATVLASGEVLIAGGYSNSRGMFPNASAWIYDPKK